MTNEFMQRVHAIMSRRLLGWSERAIAKDLGLTRYHVRSIITAGSGDPLCRSHSDYKPKERL